MEIERDNFWKQLVIYNYTIKKILEKQTETRIR